MFGVYDDQFNHEWEAVNESKKQFTDNHEDRMKELEELLTRIDGADPIEPISSKSTSEVDSVHDENGKMLNKLLNELAEL